MDSLQLKGKIAIVTGSAAGIGKGIALQMAQVGAFLVLVDVNGEKLAETAREMATVCSQILPISMDIQNESQRESLIQKTLARFGRIDILVNNVGINPVGGALTTTADVAASVFTINCVSPFLLAKRVAEVMIERKTLGNILFTSSVHSTLTFRRPYYCASKAAIDMFVKDFALEVAQFGIRVNAVAPGLTEKEDEDKRALSSYVPLGRPGTPADIGDTMVFLASPKASFITGQVLVVDGGFSLPHTWYWIEKGNLRITATAESLFKKVWRHTFGA